MQCREYWWLLVALIKLLAISVVTAENTFVTRSQGLREQEECTADLQEPESCLSSGRHNESWPNSTGQSNLGLIHSAVPKLVAFLLNQQGCSSVRNMKLVILLGKVWAVCGSTHWVLSQAAWAGGWGLGKWRKGEGETIFRTSVDGAFVFLLYHDSLAEQQKSLSCGYKRVFSVTTSIRPGEFVRACTLQAKSSAAKPSNSDVPTRELRYTAAPAI